MRQWIAIMFTLGERHVCDAGRRMHGKARPPVQLIIQTLSEDVIFHRGAACTFETAVEWGNATLCPQSTPLMQK
jgi:hypothetical protein